MDRETIFATWVPPGGAWSLWARPILFAQMPAPPSQPATGADAAPFFALAWALPLSDRPVLVVDLPGAEAVLLGMALAGRGYRPVPLFNACTGPHEVIDQGPIIEALRDGAAYLAGLTLADAAPAFLLDSRRMSPDTSPLWPGNFDNRWKVFPQDFPSATVLTERGFRRVLLIQRGRLQPQLDLAHVLLRWQDAGLEITGKDLADREPPARIRVRPPPWYRRAWLRFLEMLGLGRGPEGGFGNVIPRPSHG